MARKKQAIEEVYDDGSYGLNVKKKKKFNLFAFLVCVVIAFAIWIYVTNVADEKRKNDFEPPISGDVSTDTVNS